MCTLTFSVFLLKAHVLLQTCLVVIDVPCVVTDVQ